HRGHGRNDYPVHVLWGVLLLRIALRHVSFQATMGIRNVSAIWSATACYRFPLRRLAEAA
ncbi:MAG: hypothetical protein ACUVQG_10710, partial [Thermogutta sp.]